jgi:hypothetical protein
MSATQLSDSGPRQGSDSANDIFTEVGDVRLTPVEGNPDEAAQPAAGDPRAGAKLDKPAPIKVRGYTYHAKGLQWFRWWCKAGRHWHVNGWKADRRIRCAPPCFRAQTPCREVELDPIGEADAEILRRIENQEAPPGEVNVGKLVDTDGIYRLLLEQIRVIQRSIRARSRSDCVIAQYGRAVVLVVCWVQLRDNPDVGVDRIRDLDLFAAIDAELPKRRAAMGDLVADPHSRAHDAGPGEEAISPADMREMLLDGAAAIENLIGGKEHLGLIAWRFEAESHKLRLWRAMSRRGATPISAEHFHGALKHIVDDDMELAQAMSAVVPATSDVF